MSFIGNAKVLVAGDICLDITPVFNQRFARLSDALAPGRLVNVGQPHISLGGVVANTGLALDFFGVGTRLAGKIGNDEFGQLVRRILSGFKAESILLETCETGTSYTIVIAPPGIDRVFLHFPGANDEFFSSDISEQMLEGVRLMHFGYPPSMRRMYENDGAELISMLRRIKEKGIATSLDMSSIDPASPAGRADWRKILSEALPFVDFFLPSAEETCYMLEPELHNSWCERAGGGDITEILLPEEDIRPLGEELLKMGAGFVMLKCGAPGIYYCSSGGMDEACRALGLDDGQWCGKSGFVRGFVPERVVSATGAGDVGIAAFLAAMLKGAPPRECVRFAAAAGACCVTAYDSLGGLLPLDAISEKIEAGWRRVR